MLDDGEVELAVSGTVDETEVRPACASQLRQSRSPIAAGAAERRVDIAVLNAVFYASKRAIQADVRTAMAVGEAGVRPGPGAVMAAQTGAR